VTAFLIHWFVIPRSNGTGNDGARQNRTAKVPSQHDCTVTELRAASGPAPVLAFVVPVQHLRARSDNGANQFPIALADPPGALLPAVSFLGGFRTPALVPVDRSALAGHPKPITIAASRTFEEGSSPIIVSLAIRETCRVFSSRLIISYV
jgi:hypothetical protein